MNAERFAVPQEPTFSSRFIRHRPAQELPSSGSSSYALYMARNSIYHAVRLLGIRPGQTVLLPAYVCETAVEPLIEARVKVEFYAMTRNCEIDYDDLTARITANTAAVLAVHYFGFPTTIEKLRALCDERGIALIEDCAHVLFDRIHDRPLGTFGDASMFSWRKFLPVFDGSTLRINNRGNDMNLDLHNVPLSIQARSTKHAIANVPVVGRTLRTLKRILVRRAAPTASETASARPPQVDAYETNTDHFTLSNADFAMTWASRHSLGYSDFVAIAAARRTNFAVLWSQLNNTSGVTPLHSKPPPEGGPWVFPLIFGEHHDAHKTIRKLGVPAVAWDGVRPSRLSQAFPDADFLYHHLVFLPVHQSLDEVHLERIVSAVELAASGPTDPKPR